MRVLAVRYTSDIETMGRFLVALGLAGDAVSRASGWAEFVTTGGIVGLHGSAATEVPRRPGDVELSFEADEPLEQIKERLDAAGFPGAVIIDESFGRSLRITDPEGVELQINESDQSLYT